MADPLSLIASIIAVVGAAETIGKTISKGKILRNAPDELLALNNEVSDLTVTLRNIEHCLPTNDTERSAVSQETLQHTSTLIERAKHRLIDINQLIHYRLLKSGSFEGDFKVFRTRWMREKSEVERHRIALRDIRQNIVLQILVINSSRQSQACLAIDEVFLVSNQIHATQEHAVDQHNQNINVQTRILNQILDGNTQILNTMNTEAQNLTQIPFSDPFDTLNSQPVLGVRARAMEYNPDRNVPLCKCNFYGPKSFRSPQILDHVIGALFVGYWGNPFPQNSICTQCSALFAFSGYVNYYFPTWFCRKMLHFNLISSSYREPFISLTVRVVISGNAELFVLACKDDYSGIQLLLCNGGARPNDLEEDGGRNALSIALSYGSYEACRALITAGADPYLKDCFEVSAFDMAWNSILSASVDQNALQTLSKLFPDNDNQLESRHFSRIHKIVLGISSSNLEEELRMDSSFIDTVDSLGKTALSWSVQRQDMKATTLLLNAKASTNVSSFRGDTPLYHATFLRNFPLVKLLLHSGASPTHKNKSRTTALHFACGGRKGCGCPNGSLEAVCPSTQIIKLLLAAGSLINEQDAFGMTPLLTAAQSNFHALRILLEHGAEINTCDNDGETSLMIAITYSQYDIVQLLLQEGARYDQANKSSMTALHHAARFGSIRTMEILHAANLVNINPYAKNNDGKTAFELAQQRHSKPEGFIDLFLTLLFEIRNRNDYLARQTGASTCNVVEEVHDGDGWSEEDNQAVVTDAAESGRVPGAWPRE